MSFQRMQALFQQYMVQAQLGGRSETGQIRQNLYTCVADLSASLLGTLIISAGA
jgi:hypothetical protein